MLKLWTYQAFRLFSHSGTCWTTAISATSGAGRSSTAGMRKTFVVWKPWFRGVWTVKNCATAAHDAKMPNAAHCSREAVTCVRSGAETAAANAITTPQYMIARGVSSRTGSVEPRADVLPVVEAALIASSSLARRTASATVPTASGRGIPHSGKRARGHFQGKCPGSGQEDRARAALPRAVSPAEE